MSGGLQLTKAPFKGEEALTWTANQSFNDNVKLILGTGSDAEIYFDGTDLIVNPDAVGSGVLKVGSDIVTSNANGPELTDAASNVTVPTLIPNKTDPTTGIGNSGNDILRFIIAGANPVHLSSNGFKPNGATGIDLGDGDNRWGAVWIKTGGKVDFGGSDAILLHSSGLVTLQNADLKITDGEYLRLGITDTDGAVEGALWYDASENKLKFYNGATVETITSA